MEFEKHEKLSLYFWQFKETNAVNVVYLEVAMKLMSGLQILQKTFLETSLLSIYSISCLKSLEGISTLIFSFHQTQHNLSQMNFFYFTSTNSSFLFHLKYLSNFICQNQFCFIVPIVLFLQLYFFLMEILLVKR